MDTDVVQQYMIGAHDRVNSPDDGASGGRFGRPVDPHLPPASRADGNVV